MEKSKLEILEEFIKNKKTVYYKVLNIAKVSSIADYFAIISMPNSISVESLKSDIEDYFMKYDIKPRNNEGKNLKWVLLDYNDLVIHIFTEEERVFYNLEKLWADCEN